jgi:hypothetical protein
MQSNDGFFVQWLLKTLADGGTPSLPSSKQTCFFKALLGLAWDFTLTQTEIAAISMFSHGLLFVRS